MKYLIILVTMFLLMACIPPKVVPAAGYCLRYEMSWPVAALPTVSKCVCEEDVYTGLVAVMDTFMSKPEVITLTGVVLPKDCDVKDKTANVPDSVKDVLTN